VIRVADTGFAEQILFDQDAVATQILQKPEFQKRMDDDGRGNYLLGKEFGVAKRRWA